jgi:ABC-type nitrate/sulfonate/bicarbonate transport system permease component
MALLNPSRQLPSATLLVAILIMWELFARFVLPHYDSMATLTLPPPSSGVADAYDLLMRGTLFPHVLASARRVYGGFLVAAAVGIPLGAIMGLSPLVFRQMRPIVEVLRPIPPVAWIPITLLWFGITDTQQYFIIFIGTVFPLTLNTIAGVQGIEPIIKRAALSLGADRRTMMLVMLRGALPSVFLGVRIALGLGWFIVVASEMVAASRGLGYLITQARTAMVTERVYVGMFAIGLIGFAQDRFLTWLERKLIPWA